MDLVPSDTLLTQNTTIDSYCISADGKQLTTIDKNCLMTCFDTVTGEILWQQNLDPNGFTFQTPIFYCEIQNSILVHLSYKIFAVSQSTGEVLWTTDLIESADVCTLSPDGTYLLCIRSHSYPDNALDLVTVSTKDGSILNVLPVTGSLDPLDISHVGACAFSSDGTLFAGSYSLSDDQDHYAGVCFVTDLTTGESRTLLRQSIASYDDIACAIYFSDQDTTLTIVRPADISHAATVEKVRIQDGTLLWQTITSEAEALDMFYGSPDSFCLAEHAGHIFLSCYEYLYALDTATGKELNSRKLPAQIVHLEPAGDHYCALTLKDGTHSFCWLNSNGLFNLKDIPFFPSVSLMELGPLQDITLWNDGYLRISHTENGPEVFLATEERGFGYAVVMPEYEARSLIVKRLRDFRPDLGYRTVFAAGPKEADYSFKELSRCGDRTIVLSCKNYDQELMRYYFLDLDTGDITGSLTLPESEAWSSYTHPLPNGAGLLYKNTDTDALMFLDTKTAQSTILYDPGNFTSYIHGMINGGQDLLTITTVPKGLKLWRNTEALADIPYPDEIAQADDLYLSVYDISIGANGYILMDLLDEWTPFDWYYFCSIDNQKWYRIPTSASDADHHITCMGTVSPKFTVLGSDGLLRSYNIPSGKQLLEVDIGRNSNAVEKLQWILEDRYLAILTTDYQLLILDGSTGETVFGCQIDYSSKLSFSLDAQGNRLYIWDLKGICVDLESWTILTVIPEIDLYDPARDQVLYTSISYDSDPPTEELISYRLPTTDELIELGRQFLGE